MKGNNIQQFNTAFAPAERRFSEKQVLGQQMAFGRTPSVQQVVRGPQQVGQNIVYVSSTPQNQTIQRLASPQVQYQPKQVFQQVETIPAQIIAAKQPMVVKQIAPQQVITTKQVIQQAQLVQQPLITQQSQVQQEIVQTSHQQMAYNSNDELLVKELEAFKKKCAHLETHILQYKQKVEVVKITETQLTEVLSENRNLVLQNNDLLMQIATLKQQAEHQNLRLSQGNVFEVEYKKIQELYSQQLIYIEQLKNELLLKNNKIQELLHKDEENKRAIEGLKNQLQQQRENEDDQIKRHKKDKENADGKAQDEIAALKAKLAEKDRDLQNTFLALSNNESAKGQWELQLVRLQENINVYQLEIKGKDDLLRSKDAEIQQLRDQINQLNIKIYQFGSLDQEIIRLKQALDNKLQEIEQWKNQYAEQNLKIEELRAQNSKIYALENKIVQFTLEIERLRQIGDQKEDEVKRSKVRAGELEKEADEKKGLQYEKSQLEARLQMYSSEIEQANRNLQQKQSEIEELRIKLNQALSLQYQLQHSEQVIQGLNQKITQLETELKHYHENSQNLSSENQNLKKQLQELQFSLQSHQYELGNLKQITTDYHQVRQSVSDSEMKILTLNQTINTLNITIQQKDQEILQWKNQYQQVQEENERLKKAVNEMSLALHQLEVTLNESNNQLNYLKDHPAMIQDLQAQIEQLRFKLLQAEHNYEELLKKTNYEREQFENKIVLLTMETQRKDLIVNAKVQEIENLRKELIKFTEIQIQFQQTQDKMNYLLSEIDRLTSENQTLSKDLEVWRYKYAEISHYEYKVQDLLTKIVLCSAEIETLRSIVASSKQENTTLRNSQLLQYRN